MTRAQLSPENPLDEPLPAFPLVVLVIADHRLGNAEVVEQLEGYAGILRCDKVTFLEDCNRPGGQVAEVADRRSNQIKL